MKMADAIEYFGTRHAMALALHMRPTHIYDWGDVVPAKHAIELEILTGGKLKVDANAYKKKVKKK